MVIGNSQYVGIRKLPNPPNDARDMAKRLSELGFEVLCREQDGGFEWQSPATAEVVPIYNATSEEIDTTGEEGGSIVGSLRSRIAAGSGRQVDFAFRFIA